MRKVAKNLSDLKLSGNFWGSRLPPLSLSRNLYLPENPSLTELRQCVERYKEELAKCQNDAILNQGTIRKNCRNLIKSLSQDLLDEQHVFNRPKK